VDVGGGGGGGGGRGGGRCLLHLARVGVGPLTRRLALHACDLGWQGGDSSARFTWLVSGSGRWRDGLRCVLEAQGKGEGGSAALAGTSVDVCGSDGAGRGGNSRRLLSSARIGVGPLSVFS
jgi:hypothetical protein